MIDKVTGNRVLVNVDGNAGPYIIVNESQAQAVRESLEANGIDFTENRRSVVDQGGTDVIFDLGEGADIGNIQTILDSNP